MSDDTAVYNLGEVEAPAAPARRKPQTPVATPVRPAGTAAARAAAIRNTPPSPAVRPIDAFTDSLELFVPGTGQLLRGRWSDGFAVLAAAGFLGTMAWAIWNTMDRIAGTLTVLGYTAAGGIYALAAIYICLGGLHATNLLYGTVRGPERGHPVVTGLASGLLPGWGQLINRQPAKAATFVLGLWGVGLLWLLASPWTIALLDTYGLTFRPGFDALSHPGVRWTAPVVLWALSIYDAVATSRR